MTERKQRRFQKWTNNLEDEVEHKADEQKIDCMRVEYRQNDRVEKVYETRAMVN
jgi:hypothetical protein